MSLLLDVLEGKSGLSSDVVSAPVVRSTSPAEPFDHDEHQRPEQPASGGECLASGDLTSHH
jgi:hypothetical protein